MKGLMISGWGRS